MKTVYVLLCSRKVVAVVGEDSLELAEKAITEDISFRLDGGVVKITQKEEDQSLFEVDYYCHGEACYEEYELIEASLFE